MSTPDATWGIGQGPTAMPVRLMQHWADRLDSLRDDASVGELAFPYRDLLSAARLPRGHCFRVARSVSAD